MSKEITTREKTWDSNWASQKDIPIDNTSMWIIEEMKNIINFNGKNILELGAGSGRLSYLALKNGAKSVTLVDFSDRAFKHAYKLFNNSKKVNFIKANLLKFKSKKKYDLVFSSGLIEHFKGDKFTRCVKKHFILSNDLVAFIVPSSPHLNDIRAKTKRTIQKVGWQKPISLKNMEKICKNNNAELIQNIRFHTFYPILEVRLPKSIDKRTGGLILTICKVNNIRAKRKNS